MPLRISQIELKEPVPFPARVIKLRSSPSISQIELKVHCIGRLARPSSCISQIELKVAAAWRGVSACMITAAAYLR